MHFKGYKNFNLLTFRVFCFDTGCQAKPEGLYCSSELEKLLLRGSGVF